MFANRYTLGWGIFILAFAPAIALSDDDAEQPLRPFSNIVVASFDEVWQEPAIDFDQRITGVAMESVAGEESVSCSTMSSPATNPVAELPRLLPTPAPRLLSPSDAIREAETGLVRWLLGMLGVIGAVGLGGVYWIYQIRPALENRQSSGRLQLSSTLALPRRSGLFLVDVENQTVLVAIDGGGIRHVVPLRLETGRKRAGRQTATGDFQRATSTPRSDSVPDSEAAAFHDIYHERRSQAGDVLASLPLARTPLMPSTAAAGMAHRGIDPLTFMEELCRTPSIKS